MGERIENSFAASRRAEFESLAAGPAVGDDFRITAVGRLLGAKLDGAENPAPIADELNND